MMACTNKVIIFDRRRSAFTRILQNKIKLETVEICHFGSISEILLHLDLDLHPWLDVLLDVGTSFDLLEEVELDNVRIIFITAYDDFAIRAFKYDTIDYVLKPIEIEGLVVAVNKAIENIEQEKYLRREQLADLVDSYRLKNQRPNIVAIPSISSIDFVSMDTIIFLESSGKYTTFHIDGHDQLVSTKNIGEYETLLDEMTFWRIHKSYIINVNFIRRIDKSNGHYCELSNGKVLPIARRRLAGLKQIFRF